MSISVIPLIIQRKVDIGKTKTSSELYLMILLKNMDFHSDINNTYTDLDPPEDQAYLVRCLMVCQDHLQNSKTNENINTIYGLLINDEKLGKCFKTTALGTTIKIPVGFINKVGIF